MKSNFPTRFGITLAVLCGLVLALGVVAFRAQADVWDKKTVLTVNQPIQVQDTYLEPGTYVFKLLNSSSDRHIVQIFNQDQNHLINTVMAINNYRLQPTGDSRFTFYETPPGSAAAMHAWFYPGDNYGQEFRYPKQLRQVAAVTQVTPAPVRLPEPTPPPIVTKPETESAPAPEPEAVTAPPKREEPVEIAQNTPPPAPQAVPAPEPAKQEEPKTLPQTATPYPLVGLLGLISIGGYVLLRAKSVS
jgi:outer membrane biosynthesis protein TonB